MNLPSLLRSSGKRHSNGRSTTDDEGPPVHHWMSSSVRIRFEVGGGRHAAGRARKSGRRRSGRGCLDGDYFFRGSSAGLT